MALRSFIGLGSNLNAPLRTIHQALQVLDEIGIEVVGVSSMFRTAAIGKDAGSDFVNAVAEVRTAESPPGILRLLHQVETRFGRERSLHWGPRTLDLDLLMVGDLVIATAELSLPHPACWYRRFVLEPLFELAPDMLHPVQGTTVENLLRMIDRQPLPVRFRQAESAANQPISETVRDRFGERVLINEGLAVPGDAVMTFDFSPVAGTPADAETPMRNNRFSMEPGVVFVPLEWDPTEFVCDTIASALGSDTSRE